MNAAASLHDVGSSEAHRVGQDEVALVDHSGTLCAFGPYLFLGLVNVFAARSCVADLDPVESIRIGRDEILDRPRRTAALDFANLFEPLALPPRLHDSPRIFA